MAGESIEALAAALEAVRSATHTTKLSIEQLGRLTDELEASALLQDQLVVLEGVSLVAEMREGFPSVVCLFVERTYPVESVDAHGHVQRWEETELRTLLRVGLGKDHGQVLMRPERMADKIEEWFKATEVDFDEHPEFSNRFFVLASDEALFRQQVSGVLLDTLAPQKNLVVVIRGATLFAMQTTPASAHAMVDLARLGLALSESSAPVLRPLPEFQPSTDDDPEFDSDGALSNESFPIFRVRRSKALAYSIAGFAACGSLGWVIAMAFENLSPVVPLALIGSVVGGILGRKSFDGCSDPGCKARLPAEVNTCAGCGGTIRGRIPHENARLEAEEQLEQGRAWVDLCQR